MKKSTEIQSLPIINISDGSEIGKVRSLVVNPEKGSVDFLTVEHEDWQISVRAIPFKKVVGIGEYAVTVEHENAVIDLNEIPIANSLVNKKIRVADARLMTRKGQMIGEIVEFHVDDESGAIRTLEVKSKSDSYYLDSPHVLTWGKDIVIVKEDAAEYFRETLVEVEMDDVPTPQEAVAMQEAAATQADGLKDIESRQMELLVGRQTAEDIFSLEGELLVPKGSELTRADIQSVKEAGPSVFVELTMNIR
ncbi:PRC-barrel domain-containing protein [Rossellomorea marisflavi]|uniref:Photosystem reaction center subunit H n=1 Tax=Rossellomorea marisflavi TaxID=189381 RepID=A0A0J5YAM3_9BACI|nr:PRC-barrel domain-containing protein [Rossellomorea marisflavi]KMK93970.1 photosystem reaction center subunit H [Rossellomorea marisflavi]KML07319.1 photosystem reaction center subunit H [Rossellomorea marisflavi]KML34353.1 photosystem reaction center subunit H [Rossellomorea marisflavi]KZE43552.1 photosystem reaction center subunit H [Rossellomorea marisflavi]MCM2606011.1 PRC-barrel domain-containing protein [Rossellomorea marisflavi]